VTDPIAPCVYPNCHDMDGNPRLTHDIICQASRYQYRRTLDWLALDYVHLKSTMGTPTRGGSEVRYESPKSKSFGHPSEWASMTCTEIASALNWAEDGLRDHLGHTPGIRPDARETIVVSHGYRYLTAQFEGLCEYPAAGDTAGELDELHRKIRRHLGLTRWVQRLPTPCPWCDTLALVRTVGQIDCEACGKTIDEKHYEWLAGHIIDRLIDDYDTQAATAS
jgi:ribosomal protein L37AE/L43A